MCDEPGRPPTLEEVMNMADMIVDLREKLESSDAAVVSLVRERDAARVERVELADQRRTLLERIDQMAEALATAAERSNYLYLWKGLAIRRNRLGEEWHTTRYGIEINFATDPEAPVLRYETAREALEMVLRARSRT